MRPGDRRMMNAEGACSTGALLTPERWPDPGLAHDFLTTVELTEELLHGRRQCIIIQAIDDILALALVDDQIRFLEDRQMARDSGLGKIEVPNDLADRALAPLEQPQDLLSRAV